MNDLLLCKPGEIFLKGLNKHYFEERLVANVKRRLKPIGHFRVTYLQSALYIEAADCRYCLLYTSPSPRDRG